MLFIFIQFLFLTNTISFSANMRTVNIKRAELLAPIISKPETDLEKEEQMLFELSQVDCQFSVNGLAFNLLRGIFSYKDTGKCSNCASFSRTSENPTLNTHHILRSDLSNLAEAINMNFPEPKCPDCDTDLSIQHEFGTFMFVAVIIHYN